MKAPDTLGFVALTGTLIAQLVLRPYRAIRFTSPHAQAVGGGTITEPTQQDIVATAVIEERHHHRLRITDHPVEQGTVMTDHAYKLPAALSIVYGFAAGSDTGIKSVGSLQSDFTGIGDPDFLVGLYQRLLDIQQSRTLCEIFTGKKLYENMLLEEISMHNTKETEHSLIVHVSCREVLIAQTAVAQLPDNSLHRDPSVTGDIVDQGQQQLKPGTGFNEKFLP